jgi:hypothetical protein
MSSHSRPDNAAQSRMIVESLPFETVDLSVHGNGCLIAGNA